VTVVLCIGFALALTLLVLAFLVGELEWRDHRKARQFQQSALDAATADHPAGKSIPPSAEVWMAGHGVYDQDDPDLACAEAIWDAS